MADFKELLKTTLSLPNDHYNNTTTSKSIN